MRGSSNQIRFFLVFCDAVVFYNYYCLFITVHFSYFALKMEAAYTSET